MSEVRPCTSIARRGSKSRSPVPVRDPAAGACSQGIAVRPEIVPTSRRSSSSALSDRAPARELIGPSARTRPPARGIVALAHEEEHVAAVEHDELRPGDAVVHLLDERGRHGAVPASVQDQRGGVDLPEPRGAVVASRRRRAGAVCAYSGWGWRPLNIGSERRRWAARIGAENGQLRRLARARRDEHEPASPGRGVRARASSAMLRAHRDADQVRPLRSRARPSGRRRRPPSSRSSTGCRACRVRPAPRLSKAITRLPSTSRRDDAAERADVAAAGRRSGAPARRRRAPRSRCQAR